MRLAAMSEMIVNGPFLRDVESGRLNTAEVSQWIHLDCTCIYASDSSNILVFRHECKWQSSSTTKGSLGCINNCLYK